LRAPGVRDIETFDSMSNAKERGKDTRGRKKSTGRIATEAPSLDVLVAKLLAMIQDLREDAGQMAMLDRWP